MRIHEAQQGNTGYLKRASNVGGKALELQAQQGGGAKGKPSVTRQTEIHTHTNGWQAFSKPQGQMQPHLLHQG